MAFGGSASLSKELWRRDRDALVLKQAERWYVVHSLPRREVSTETQLLAQGFRVFLPRMTRTVRHARRLRTLDAPVFPRYLFIVLDLHKDRWRSVNGTVGVASLIMARDMPEPVPQGVVEELLAYTDATGVVRFDRDLREGQSIRVTTGLFVHALGRLEHLAANGRARVLLDIMGGNVPALIDRSALEAV
ncbi:MAG: transcription termination/antitermination protein NusG [Methylocella sp.]